MILVASVHALSSSALGLCSRTRTSELLGEQTNWERGKYFHYIHLVESVLQHIVKFKISPFLLHWGGSVMVLPHTSSRMRGTKNWTLFWSEIKQHVKPWHENGFPHKCLFHLELK